MSQQNFIYSNPQHMQNTFWKILEIKTGKKDLLIKAVYVLNSTASWEWTYFVYYYDIFTHTFYINDIDKLCNNTRTSAINIIENIVNKAYKQEMNSFAPMLQKIQMNKKPRVFCIYLKKLTNEIIIDKVNLKAVRWLEWTIIGFQNPSWDKAQ
jgi:hypothetical protein